jgi:hypothetical protein
LRGWRFSSLSILSLQKWIEWLWSTKMIAEILSIYLDVWERDRSSNSMFRFMAPLSILSHFAESPVRRSTSIARITFRTRYFRLSSLPQSHIDPHGIASQQLISSISSTLPPVGKFQFFE